MSVLVVEDYEEWADVVSRGIRRARPGTRVTVCATAAEALHALADGGYDAAIVDVVLRGTGTGLDVAREAVRRGVPTTLTSSHTDARVPGASWMHKDGLIAALPSLLAALLTP